jgi:hypothetical protein
MTQRPNANELTEIDPALVEIVERKLDPYRRLVSPEMLEHLRREAFVLLSSHPYPAALVKQLQPPPVVEFSTSVPTADEGAVSGNGSAEPVSTAAASERSRRGRGGGR